MKGYRICFSLSLRKLFVIFYISKIIDKKPVKDNPGDSRHVSLEMFRQGKSIKEIAAARNFVDSTIEGHLASFILSGDVNITDLIPEVRLHRILKVIKEVGGRAAFPIKEKLGDDYSYGEIRAVMNHYEWLQKSGKEV